jgi:hypothetical protein
MSPAALDRLHDFVQPPLPSWMPHTIGWYVVFAVLALAMTFQLIKWIRDWKRNRYRRVALQELPHTAIEDLSALLKRTALAAWPRQTVASLTGEAWLRFLNRTAEQPLFETKPGSEIEELAVRGRQQLNAQDEEKLRHRAKTWIRRHRVRS